MLVATADEHHFLFLQSQIAHIDVCRHIHSGEVADMHSAIGVWQGGGHGGALKILIFHIYNNVLSYIYIMCITSFQLQS